MARPVGKVSNWYRLRWEVLERDDFTCQYCGQRAPNIPIEVDHRVPVSDGGTDDKENLVAACWSCNRGKGYSQWGERGRGQQAQVRISTRTVSKTTKMMWLMQANPDVTDQELAEATGLEKTAVATLRYRLLTRIAAISGEGRDELWHDAMARLIRERGPMTANELAAFGGFTQSRIDDSIRRGKAEASIEFVLRDGRYSVAE